MSKMVFINLPVKDLKKSMEFFEALGFSKNPQFTDEKAACMVISEHNYVMLLTHPFFETFATKPISDAHQSTGALYAIGLESKDAVNNMVETALKLGSKEPRPAQDHGFMYARTFEDPDGHTWEATWMDTSQM